eukprot:jgi/Ulvmu1/3635/UM017_0047.1
MGSVERADYMDNIKVAEVEQTIQKVKELQRQYFREQERLGKIQLRPPTPAKAKQSLQEKYGLPEHLAPMRKDPETAIALTFSRQLWGNAVPGYVVRDPTKTISQSKADFIWDEDEIDYMKQQRLLDKTFNRRRDDQTHYVECKALYDAMMGKPR